MNLQLQLYLQQVKCLRTGNTAGGPALSKPILLLCINDCISTKHLKKNEIIVGDKFLQGTYKMLYEYYAKPLPKDYLPFFIRPFFHMSSEPFYELVWKSDLRPPMLSHTPSAKYLRDHLLYAKLDDALWKLLQDGNNRDLLKQTIIDRYIGTKSSHANKIL